MPRSAPLGGMSSEQVPQDIEAEQRLLACLWHGERASLEEAAQGIKPWQFYRLWHQPILGAILRLHRRGARVDYVTIHDELERTGRLEAAGGAEYLGDLERLSREMNPDTVGGYMRIVARHAALRLLYEGGKALVGEAWATDGDPLTIARRYERRMAVVRSACQTGHARRRRLTQPLSEIDSKPVKWLWRGYIPLGAVTFLEGPPDLGKTTLAGVLTASITQGRPLPGARAGDLADLPPGGSTVLFISAEDSYAQTIVPRLKAAGADMTKVFRYWPEPDPSDEGGDDGESEPDDDLLLPRDLDTLEAAIAEHHAVLVVLDPLFAMLDEKEVDTYKDQRVRHFMKRLRRLAERRGCTLLPIRHHNRREGVSALEKGMGGIGWAAAARSVLTVSAHPEHEDHRIVSLSKHNLGPAQSGWAYRITYLSDQDVGRFEWQGTVDHKPDELVNRPAGRAEEQSEVERAIQWLLEYLADGPKRTTEVEVAADKAKVSRRTVDRARKHLKEAGQLDVYREHVPGPWLLKLLEEEQPKAPAQEPPQERQERQERQHRQGFHTAGAVAPLHLLPLSGGDDEEVSGDSEQEEVRCVMCGSAEIEQYSAEGRPYCAYCDMSWPLPEGEVR